MAVVGRSMVATGSWLLEGERGGWWNPRHNVLTCTTVDGDDGMHRCHLDDVANLDVLRCGCRGCCVPKWVWAVDDGSG